MKAREMLAEYLRAKEETLLLRQQIASQRALAERLTGWTDGDRVEGTKEPDKIGQAVAKLADMEADYSDRILALIKRMNEIQNELRKVEDPKAALVVELRYIDGKEWETVAAELCCTTRWAMELRDRACEEIDRRNEE